MMQPGLPPITGIVLMSLILSAEAQTTPEPTTVQEDCLDFTKIASNEITLSWNSTCFSDDPSYKIKLTGSKTCTKDDYRCDSDTCYIEIKDMECGGSPIRPCESVTYIVSGKSSNYQGTKATIVAPLFTSSDWQLQVSENNSLLNAGWGPPMYSDSFAKCSTNASVMTTCPGVDGNNLKFTDFVGIPDPAVNATYELDISDCQGNITFTVTYMSGESPTETTNSSTIYYKPVSTTTTSDPTTITTESSDSTTAEVDDGLSDGAIAGIVIGSVGGTALIVGGVFALKIKKIGCFK